MSARRFALVALVCASCSWTRHAPARPSATLSVGRGSPTIDGDLDEPCWLASPWTSRFVDAQTGAAQLPFTQARAVADAGALYVAIYSADEDLESSDVVGVVLRRANGEAVVVDVDPSGRVRWHAPGGADAPVPDGVGAGVDADGTYAEPADQDEEWVVELRIPWSALGVRAPYDVRANFFRRERPPGATPRELGWVAWHRGGPERLAALGLLRRR